MYSRVAGEPPWGPAVGRILCPQAGIRGFAICLAEVSALQVAGLHGSAAFCGIGGHPADAQRQGRPESVPAPDRNGSQLAEAPVASRDELELQLTKIWDELGLSKIIKNQVKLNFNMIGI